MTTRLYLDDPEQLQFDALVLSVRELGDRPAAVLDRTAFHPEGGGQPGDRGWLARVEVIDVQEVHGEILHVLASALAPGPVHGEVDPALADQRRDIVEIDIAAARGVVKPAVPVLLDEDGGGFRFRSRPLCCYAQRIKHILTQVRYFRIV